MASSIPRVLIVGATGTLGSHVTRAFQLPQYKNKVFLSLFVRKETAEKAGPKKDAIDSYVKNGATLVYGDLSQSESELTNAFAGVNILISAVGGTQLGEQAKLIPAAKAAGVRWFIPSEFGLDAHAIGRGSAVPIFDIKISIAEATKAAGLDYTLFLTGAFTEYALTPIGGLNLANGEVTAPGSFDTPSVTTPLADIGITVADAITSGKGKNQVIHSGVPYTYEQFADAVEKATGKKFTRSVRSVADAEAALAKNPGDIGARFTIVLAKQQGKGTTWPASQTYAAKNGLQQDSFEEIIRKLLSK